MSTKTKGGAKPAAPAAGKGGAAPAGQASPEQTIAYLQALNRTSAAQLAEANATIGHWKTMHDLVLAQGQACKKKLDAALAELAKLKGAK